MKLGKFWFEWYFSLKKKTHPTPDDKGNESELWDEITYPFLNFNGCTVEV